MWSHHQGVLPIWRRLSSKSLYFYNFKERTKSDGIEVVEKDLLYVITGNISLLSYFLIIFVPPEIAHLYLLPYRWKIRQGYVSSVKIFRRLKVSSNRKKFVTFHRRKHLTNFEISYFSKNIISEKRYRYIFLIYVHVNLNICNSFLVVLKIVPLGSHYVRF